MISRRDVERLYERPPTTASPVLSVYLDVDQSRAANRNREFEAALKARLRALEQSVAPADHAAFRADAARVQRFVADYAPHAATLVTFADDSVDLFWSGDLGTTLPTDARWEPTPYVRPLLEALDEHAGYGVVLVDKERARVFTVALGDIREEGEALATAEVRHKNASGMDHLRSQMHFQRQDDLHVRWHLAQVADLLDDVARVHGFDRLVIAGPVEATSELGRLLPQPLRGHILGTVRLAIEAPADDVLARTRDLVREAEREIERTRVQQALDRGARGLAATLTALQEGRVRFLLYADGFESRGKECPRCRSLFGTTADSACAYCGERLLPLDDLLGRAVARAAEAGAEVEKVHGDAAMRLRDAGGIAALLRF